MPVLDYKDKKFNFSDNVDGKAAYNFAKALIELDKEERLGEAKKSLLDRGRVAKIFEIMTKKDSYDATQYKTEMENAIKPLYLFAHPDKIKRNQYIYKDSKGENLNAENAAKLARELTNVVGTLKSDAADPELLKFLRAFFNVPELKPTRSTKAKKTTPPPRSASMSKEAAEKAKAETEEARARETAAAAEAEAAAAKEQSVLEAAILREARLTKPAIFSGLRTLQNALYGAWVKKETGTFNGLDIDIDKRLDIDSEVDTLNYILGEWAKEQDYKVNFAGWEWLETALQAAMDKKYPRLNVIKQATYKQEGTPVIDVIAQYLTFRFPKSNENFNRQERTEISKWLTELSLSDKSKELMAIMRGAVSLEAAGEAKEKGAHGITTTDADIEKMRAARREAEAAAAEAEKGKGSMLHRAAKGFVRRGSTVLSTATAPYKGDELPVPTAAPKTSQTTGHDFGAMAQEAMIKQAEMEKRKTLPQLKDSDKEPGNKKPGSRKS